MGHAALVHDHLHLDRPLEVEPPGVLRVGRGLARDAARRRHAGVELDQHSLRQGRGDGARRGHGHEVGGSGIQAGLQQQLYTRMCVDLPHRGQEAGALDADLVGARVERELLDGRQPDHLDAVAPGMQQMRETVSRLAGGRGEHHAFRAIEFALGEKVINQERQHEQRPQQRLIIALLAFEARIAANARIGVVDGRHALPVRGGIAQAAFVHIGGLDHEMRRHREIAEQGFACGNPGMLRGNHLA